MGKYKKCFYIFCILLSFLLINVNVKAENLSVSEFNTINDLTHFFYQSGSNKGSVTSEIVTTWYGVGYLHMPNNVTTNSSNLLSPTFIEVSYTSSTLDNVDFVSFNVMTLNSQLTNVTISNSVGYCYTTTSYSFNHANDVYKNYSVICPNLNFYASGKFIFYLTPDTVGDSINLFVKQYFTIGYYSTETNDLLKDANDKQQQIINKTNETNNKLTETNTKLQETNESINKVDDTLNNSDSAEATDSAGSFFSGFTTDTFGLTSIITAPLNLITSVTSSTCSPVGLPVPFVENTTLELPCLRGIYEQHFGTLLNIYQTITFGIVAYWVCVRIFALVKDFKNPEHDEIEVMDL